MKTTKEDILLTSLHLFAESGFDAVSTGMIAEQLGITKGALYRHYKNKQEIFDSIVQRMFEKDEERAGEDSVPEEKYEKNPGKYEEVSFKDFCDYVVNQFEYWTKDEFASSFRRMITIEQFKSPEKMKLYQDVIGRGPIDYSEDIFREMIKRGVLNKDAEKTGPRKLAVEFYAPLKLSIDLFDGGGDYNKLKKNLKEITDGFKERYIPK